jgi:hypothetical protein
MTTRYTGVYGPHDQGERLQRWLDAGGGELGVGHFLSGRQLLFPTGCRIEGVHKSLSVIGAHPSYVPPPGDGFFINREQHHTGDPVTRGVQFSNFSIRGSVSLRETAVGLGLIGVVASTFRNVAISGFKWLVTPANCTRLVFDRCEFSDWGCAVQPGDIGNINCEGGTALLGHSAFPNTHFDLIHCHWHDGAWTAIDTSHDGGAHHWRLISPRIERVMEAGIFGRLTDSMVTDAKIHDVRVRAVSAHGFEGGMVRSDWTGGTISGTDGQSIILLGSQDAVVRGVGVFDPRCKAVGLDSAIAVRAGIVDGLTIEECYGSDHLNGPACPISFHGDGAHPMDNVLVRGRHFHRWTRGNIVREHNDPRGVNFVIEE